MDKLVLLLISVVLLNAIWCIKYEGDKCRTIHHNRNTTGTCRLARDCQHAFRDTNRNPDLCMFTRNDVVICCPKIVEVAALTLDVQPVDEDAEGIGRQRISQIKCLEYGKLTQKVDPVAALVPDPIYFEVSTSNCDNITPLIVNGEKTRHGEFPHMAAIGYKIKHESGPSTLKFICGGVLISENFVMTAAHCTNVYDDKPSLVRLGGQKVITNDNDRNLFLHDVTIAQVITHPEYKRSLYYNDIGLLKLATKVRFTDYIRPACLWYKDRVDSEQTIATGWGVTKFGGQKSDDLMKVALSLIPFKDCQKAYGRHRKIPRGILRTQMCAGSRNGAQDTCQGDSGGPIQIVSEGNSCLYYIVGITSFGKNCAVSDAPGVYTRVSAYLDWIEKIVWMGY